MPRAREPTTSPKHFRLALRHPPILEATHPEQQPADAKRSASRSGRLEPAADGPLARRRNVRCDLLKAGVLPIPPGRPARYPRVALPPWPGAGDSFSSARPSCLHTHRSGSTPRRPSRGTGPPWRREVRTDESSPGRAHEHGPTQTDLELDTRWSVRPPMVPEGMRDHPVSEPGESH